MRYRKETPEEIYLDSVRLLEKNVRLMRANLIKLREALDIKGVSFEHDGSARGSRTTDKMAEAILKVVAYESELNEEEVKLAMLRLEVEQVINALEDFNEREVLKRRYLLHQSYETIMAEMDYSESRVYAFRREGIAKIKIPEKSTVNNS